MVTSQVSPRSLKVVHKHLGEYRPTINGFFLKLSEPPEWDGVECHGKVDGFNVVAAFGYFNGLRVAPKPLPWFRLSIICVNVDQLELSRLCDIS